MKKILFASDFSRISDRAEQYARTIAGAVGAKVTILHSVEPVEGAADDENVRKFLDSRKATAAAKAEEVAKRFRADGIECDVTITSDKRWKSIADTGKSGQYDLVILGSHKIEDGDKVYLGTTTHKVFFACDVPLMVVPVG